ncbi:transposase [Bifidobacterium pullorum]|uniref:transposase n=1 Tax=Bifidobacterium pullorum TaxID=78448 RepID=UPI0029422941|nr:transposase [Bifidobacterium pullorum]
MPVLVWAVIRCSSCWKPAAHTAEKQCRNCLRKIEAKQGLKAAASCLREGVGEATTYLLDEYPVEHRRRIRTNNMIERLNREIRRRTRVVGSFPDGRSALMLVCARIRYVTANQWSTRRYLDMSRLGDTMQTTD